MNFLVLMALYQKYQILELIICPVRTSLLRPLIFRPIPVTSQVFVIMGAPLAVLATVWNILTESQAVAKIESGGSFDSLVLVNRDVSFKDGECLSKRDLRQVLSVGMCAYVVS